MIFVTVGTGQFPFDRLLRIMDEAAGLGMISRRIFAQTGSSKYKPKNFESQDIISFEQMICWIQRAQVVVAHAGAGTAVLCFALGKTPILFPRRGEFGETVDNHQLEFAEKMEKSAGLAVARNEKELIDKILSYKMAAEDITGRATGLSRDLCNYLKMWVDRIS